MTKYRCYLDCIHEIWAATVVAASVPVVGVSVFVGFTVAPIRDKDKLFKKVLASAGLFFHVVLRAR